MTRATKLRKSNPAAVKSTKASATLSGGQHRLSEVRAPAPEATCRRRARIVKDSDRYRFSNFTKAQPLFRCVARLGRGKVIPVSVLRVRDQARAQASAGAAPKRRPAPIDKAVAKASTSTPTWSSPGTRRGTHRGRGAHDRGGHGEAQRTAGEAEDDALGEQLADNSAGPRAEGAAEGDPAREQQAGHVGAGHQQH